MSILNKLKGKSFLDLFWSFSDNVLQQTINFVVGIVLARLLLPDEFGLIGIVTVFIALSTVLLDGGLSMALINKVEVSESDYNTSFYFNIFFASLLYFFLFFSSDWISGFFGNSEVEPLLKITGLNLVLLAFSSIHRTILIKQLNFKLITVISLISVLVSAICALWMAYRGYGVYSLVYRILIGQSITLVLFWLLNKWRPKLIFSIDSFKELFSYGGNLMLSGFLNKLHSNIYYLLIGKYFGTIQLGYYTRANTFKELASNNIALTINRVSFSTLSKIRDEKELHRKFFFFQNVTFIITSFCMLFLFLFSEEIIFILLSEKWVDSIEILKIISLSGVYVSLYSLNLDYLAVVKRTKLYLKIEVLGKILVVPVLLLGIFYNFTYFLYAIIVHSILMYAIVLYCMKSLIIEVIWKQVVLLSKYCVAMFILILITDYYPMSFDVVKTVVIKTIVLMLVFIVTHYSQLKLIFKSK